MFASIFGVHGGPEAFQLSRLCPIRLEVQFSAQVMKIYGGGPDEYFQCHLYVFVEINAEAD